MIRLFKNLSKKDWLFIFVSIGFIALQVWLDLKMPDYMSEITMLVQTPGSAMKDIVVAGGKMLLCALGSLISSVVVAVFAITTFGVIYDFQTYPILFKKI